MEQEAQETLFLQACAARDLPLLAECLARGLKPNRPLSSGLTPLAAACQKAFAEAVPVLCGKGAQPDKAAADTTPLLEAARNNGVDCARVLLDCGADPNAGTKTLFTPLMLAARSGHGECLRLLLERGAEVNRADKYQWTALHEAAFAGHAPCVTLLLAHGADPLTGTRNCYTEHHSFSIGGFTPLHYAAHEGHAPVVGILLECTPVDIATKSRETPLIFATGGNVETVRMLLDAGANIEAVTRFGVTPIFSAVGQGSLDIMRVLLDAGANPNSDHSDMGTPISMAATIVPGLPNRDKIAMVRLLLEYGADINRACRAHKGTALRSAVCAEDRELIGFLLEHGARDNTLYLDKYKTVDIAEMRGMHDVAELIRRYS